MEDHIKAMSEMNVSARSLKEAGRIGVMVLGMHRSGTSAITRVLSFLGCDLPQNVMGPSEGNAQGHWESNEVVVLNQAILASAGNEWDDWLPFNRGWFESPVKKDFLARAIAVLDTEFRQSRLIVLKDPRICRFAPLWLEAMEKVDVSPAFIIPLRNPIEVARSLQARDGINIDYALLIWLRHVLDGEFYTRNYPRSFSTFDQLLDDWKQVAQRAELNLGLSWPRFSLQTSADVSAFLSSDHRHQLLDDRDLGRSLVLPSWVRETYDILIKWAQHGEDGADFAHLDAIRKQFDISGPAFFGLVNEKLRQSVNVGAAEREREQLAIGLQDAEERLKVLAGVLADKDATVESLQAREALDAVLKTTFERSLEEAQDQLAASEQDISDLRRAIEVARSQEALLLDQVRQAEEQILDLRHSANEMEHRTQSALARADAAEHALEESEAVSSSLRNDLIAVQAQKESLDQILHLSESRLLQKDEELEQAAAALADSVVRERQANELREGDGRRNRRKLMLVELDLKSALADTEDAKQKLRQKSDALSDLQDENKSLLRTISARSEEIATLSDELLQQDDAAQRSAQVLTELQDENKSLLRTISARFEEIATLSDELLQQGDAAQRSAQKVDWLRNLNNNMSDAYVWWWRFLPRTWQRRKVLAHLSREGLFDAETYLEKYPDVELAGMDPLRHYMMHGIVEERQI